MTNIYRVEGGLGAIVGGLCLVVGHLLNYLGGRPTGTTEGTAFVFAGHIVLVFAFIGLYSHQQAHGPSPVGRMGMLLSTIGTVLVSAIVFVELAGTTTVDTTPVFEAASTTTLYTVGPLVFVLGMVTVGASILRRHDLPRGAGGLLVAGTAVFAGASIVTDFASVLTLAGAVVTAAAFGWLGVILLMRSNDQRASEGFS